MKLDGVLPFRISICGIPEIAAFADQSVSHVLSILDPDMDEPPALADLGARGRMTRRFDDIIDDRPPLVAPARNDVTDVLQFGTRLAHEDADHLLIHCHAGVSRSTAMAVLLMAQVAADADEAIFAHLRNIRPVSWPNSRIVEIGDRMLGRSGSLVDALHRHYLLMARVNRELAEALRAGGRAREVPPAEVL